jgi:hypothetical protein
LTAIKGVWGKNRTQEPVLSAAFLGDRMISGTVKGNLFEWKDQTIVAQFL